MQHLLLHAAQRTTRTHEPSPEKALFCHWMEGKLIGRTTLQQPASKMHSVLYLRKLLPPRTPPPKNNNKNDRLISDENKFWYVSA